MKPLISDKRQSLNSVQCVHKSRSKTYSLIKLEQNTAYVTKLPGLGVTLPICHHENKLTRLCYNFQKLSLGRRITASRIPSKMNSLLDLDGKLILHIIIVKFVLVCNDRNI